MRSGVVAVCTLIGLVGCGGSTTGGTGGTGGVVGGSGGTAATGGSGGTGGTGGTGASGGTAGIGGSSGGSSVGQPPPPDPNAPPASSTTPTTLAVKKLFLGDTDSQGNPDPNGWRSFGLNVDGLVSTKGDTNHCKFQEGATKSSIQTDGDNGIDNSFGKNLMPLNSSLASDLSATVTEAINNGEFSLLFHFEKLGPEPNQNAVGSAFYVGAPLLTPPSWNGGDVWPVAWESVVGGSVTQPVLVHPQGYVTAGTWVAAPAATAVLFVPLVMQGFALPLRIHHARIVAKISGTGPSAQATSGVISGVLSTDEYVQELKKVAGGFDKTLCEGATFESIAQQVRAASDIMKDGSNGDPTKMCDGISIGLGFQALAVKLGGIAPAQPPPPNPCN